MAAYQILLLMILLLISEHFLNREFSCSVRKLSLALITLILLRLPVRRLIDIDQSIHMAPERLFKGDLEFTMQKFVKGDDIRLYMFNDCQGLCT